MLGTPDGSGAPGGEESELWAPRMALLVTLAVLSGYTLITVLNVLQQKTGPSGLVGLAFCLAVVVALQFAHSTRRPRTWPVRTRVLTLAAQAVATYLPLAWIGLPWGAMAGFLAGSILLVSEPGRLRWLLYVASAAGIVPLVVIATGPGGAVYGIGVTLLTGLVVFGVSSLSDLVTEIHEARRAQAGMAVVQERLRVARDLHDLLGFSLSVIMLKSELSYRLLPAAPDRARSEVIEVLDVARQALSDVRLIATGYRDMSLAAETESALSVLSASRIDARANLSCGPLPQEVDTVLAIGLREAVTNVLRHSKAQHCVITATRDGEIVRLEISNDGVDEGHLDTPVEGGSGLGNLATRLRGIGGSLTNWTGDDGWFYVVAEAPAGHPHDADPTEAALEAQGLTIASWAPRMAKGTVVAMLTGYSLITVINAAAEARSGIAMLGFLGCFAVVVTLQTLHSLRRPRMWQAQTRILTLGAQVLATYAPLLWLHRPWGTMVGFLSGSILIATSGRLRWALYGVSVAVIAPTAIADGASLAYVGYLVASSLVTGLVVYGITALYRLVTELHEARGTLAEMAVNRERLIVARELHQVLGESLSAVSLKCELIHRLLPRAPGPAREELATVLDVSRKALADVRLVASGYRGELAKHHVTDH